MIVISWSSDFPFYLFVCLLFSFSFFTLLSLYLVAFTIMLFCTHQFPLFLSLRFPSASLSLRLLLNSTILLFSSTLPLIFPEPSFCLPPFIIPHTPVTPYSYSFLFLFYFFSFSSSSFHSPPPLSCPSSFSLSVRHPRPALRPPSLLLKQGTDMTSHASTRRCPPP